MVARQADADRARPSVDMSVVEELVFAGALKVVALIDLLLGVDAL